MIQIPGFRTVLRGYDPTEVDRAIGDLCKARDQARAEAADGSLALGKAQAAVSQLEEQLAGYRTRLAKLESAKEEQPSFSDIGARIGRMLALAEDEASELRTRARAESERLSQEVNAEVEQLRSNAERHSRDVISKADTEAARILEAAKRQADEIIDYADREAVARREEAEAVYEAHRARAAAAAAEFEQNLAERREKAAEELATQTATNEAAIARLKERHDNLELEAENMLFGAKEQAEAILKSAREEAVQHIAAARASAVKIRRESERELQAAVARRDSINAQLANVRQMLNTLDNTGSSLSIKSSDEEETPSAEESEFSSDQTTEDVATDEVVAEGDGAEEVVHEAEAVAEESSEDSADELTEVLDTQSLAKAVGRGRRR
jgi:cell division septum initiation protein DivIVA